MSRWTDSFKSHPFHADWASLEQALENGKLPAEADLATVQEFARLRKIVAYLSGLLDNIDPELASSNLLGSLQAQTQAMLNETNNYLVNGNVAHLTAANVNADVMTPVLAQAAISPVGTTKAALTKAATAYQEILERHAVTYDQHMKALTAESEQRVAASNQRVEVANEGISKLDARIAAMEAQLPTQLSSYNTTFQASEAQRADKYERWSDTYQLRLNDQFQLTAAQAGATVDVLLTYRDQAEKVLGTVVDTAQAGAYATYAGEEKRSANLFRRLALVMMGAAALILFLPEVAHAVKEAAGYNVDWQKALARLPFSLILFAPALYLAKESSKHRTNEVANRRRQHILTTIGPYLALLDAKKAEEIKGEVAKSIFADTVPMTDDKANDTGNLLAQLANLLAMKAVK